MEGGEISTKNTTFGPYAAQKVHRGVWMWSGVEWSTAKRRMDGALRLELTELENAHGSCYGGRPTPNSPRFTPG